MKKISEIIEVLQSVEKQYGNLDFDIDADDNDGYSFVIVDKDGKKSLIVNATHCRTIKGEKIFES